MATADKQQPQTGVSAPELISVKNPVSGAHIGDVPVTSREQVQQVVERARAAQPAWEALGVVARGRLLRRWADLLWENQLSMMQTIRSETGKNDTSAWLEIVVLDNTVAYYQEHAPSFLRPQKRRPVVPLTQRARVYYKPYGVAGFITPWNYPLNNAFIDLIAALFAGNTVVLKPSEITPFTSLYAVDLMYRAGIPHDVVQVVTGGGSTGAALADYVDYISFTGSTATGRKVAVRAAERLIPCSLELGGKDPLIILQDANLELAATAALVGSLENAGQACVAVERVYVEAAIYDRFIERLLDYAQRLTVGFHNGFDVHVGSLTNERELLRCERQIADAVSKGAKVIFGGSRRPDLGPLFLEPTILVDVDHAMAVMREETFGPLIPVMRVKDAEEAIRLANDSEYGLSGAIFTRDLKRGERLATRIESGDISVNRTQWTFGTTSLPMGGVKNSGLGRRNGPEGLLRFVRTQSILVDTQIGLQPSLTLADPFGIRVFLLLRFLRRFIKFLRM